MLALMLGLAALGLALLGGGTALVWHSRRRGAERVALGRVLQAVGVGLLVGALLVRPHHPGTAAFPPTPDERVPPE